MRERVPRLLWLLFWFLVAILLIILAAVIVHAVGGFDLRFYVGHFHLNIGVN